jgi:hypothetical protein
VRLFPVSEVPTQQVQRLPLAEARHAHELLESATSKGKLVLVT